MATVGGRLARLTPEGVSLDGQLFPLRAARAIASLPDGRAVVVHQGEAEMLVSWLTPEGLSEPTSTFIPLRESPMRVAVTMEGDHIWVLSEDQQRAARYKLASDGGKIVADRSARLPEHSHPDVAVSGDGALWVAAGSRLVRVEADGTQRTLPREDSAPIERVQVGPHGALWVLTFNGELAQLDPRSGRALRVYSLEGAGVALAVDEAGVAVVSATWTPSERSQLSVHLFDTAGAFVWSSEVKQDVVERGLVLTPTEVVVGGPLAVARLRRQDGMTR